MLTATASPLIHQCYRTVIDIMEAVLQ